MHAVKHPSSRVDNDVPGVGMHFSKQCSFTFCRRKKSVTDHYFLIFDKGSYQRTEISCRALLIAICCRTWSMTCALGSDEALLMSMVAKGDFGLLWVIKSSQICRGRRITLHRFLLSLVNPLQRRTSVGSAVGPRFPRQMQQIMTTFPHCRVHCILGCIFYSHSY